MKRYLFISIDTEEDLWGEYTVTSPPLENIKNIYMLQEIFERHNAIPTYLVNYPVASDSYSVNLFSNLLKQKKCDIGTHCHPWNNPPFAVNGHLEYNSFMCNLSEELILGKMTLLHNTIQNNFNFTPIVFRAGRWGVGENVIKVIQKLGYKIDTSIVPFTSWENCFGSKVYKKLNGVIYFDNLCYKIEKCFDCKKKGYCVVEIPPTIGFFQKDFDLCHNIRSLLMKRYVKKFRLLGAFDRLGLLNYRLLSPETTTLEDMVKLSKVIMSKGYKFLNMSFHSQSLLPGKSPFVGDDNELTLFLNKIDKYLEFIKKEGVECIGMSNAMEVLS